jgi:hypothetical protein
VNEVINNQKKLVEERKLKLISENNVNEIQKKADRAIISINQLIKRKQFRDLAPNFQKIVTLLRKDPASGLAMLDVLDDELSKDLEDLKNENANFCGS